MPSDDAKMTDFSSLVTGRAATWGPDVCAIAMSILLVLMDPGRQTGGDARSTFLALPDRWLTAKRSRRRQRHRQRVCLDIAFPRLILAKGTCDNRACKLRRC